MLTSANLEGSMRVKNDSKKDLISIVANISSEHIEYVAIERLWAKEKRNKETEHKKNRHKWERWLDMKREDPRKRDKSEKKIKQIKKK